MKLLRLIPLLLLASWCPAADVEVVSEDFVGTRQAGKTVTMMYLPSPAIRNSALIARNPITRTNDSTGSCWFSNAAPGAVTLTLNGTYPTSYTLIIPDTNGAVSASALVTNAASISGTNMLDLRFISGILSNGYAVTNGGKVYWVVTNATAGTGSGDVTYSQAASTSNMLFLTSHTNRVASSNLTVNASNSLASLISSADGRTNFQHLRVTNSASFGGTLHGNGGGLTNLTAYRLYDPAADGEFSWDGESGGWLSSANVKAATFYGSGAGLTDIPTNVVLVSTNSALVWPFDESFVAGISSTTNYSVDLWYSSFGSTQRAASIQYDGWHWWGGMQFHHPDYVDGVLGTDASGYLTKLTAFTGTFTGNASGLTNLDASKLVNTSEATLTNAANSFVGTFAGNGSGLTNLNATNLVGNISVPARITGPNGQYFLFSADSFSFYNYGGLKATIGNSPVFYNQVSLNAGFNAAGHISIRTNLHVAGPLFVTNTVTADGFIQPSNPLWYAVTSSMPVNSMARAWSNGSTLEFTIHRKGDGSFTFTNSYTHAE